MRIDDAYPLNIQWLSCVNISKKNKTKQRYEKKPTTKKTKEAKTK